MQNHDAHRTTALSTRLLASACILSLLTAPMPAWSAPTNIADKPLSIGIDIPPTMVFGLDDSGSMDSEVLLPTNDGAMWWNTGSKSATGKGLNDEITSSKILNFNKDGSISKTWRKYVYLFPNGKPTTAITTSGRRLYGDNEGTFKTESEQFNTAAHYAIPPTKQFAWARSAYYNPLYYDPAKTYKPWKPAYDTAAVTFADAATSGYTRSHPLYPLGETGTGSSGASTPDSKGAIALTGTFPLASGAANPMTAQSADWRFIMYPGMTIPGGKIARYKGNKTSCSASGVFNNAAWTCPLANDYILQDSDGPVVAQIEFYPATYYMRVKGATDGMLPDGTLSDADGYGLKKYEIKESNSPFPTGRSYKEELQNFANWYLYYRKRHLMLNSAVGDVLSELKGIRASIFYFNDYNPLQIYDLNSGDPAKNSKSLIYQFYKRMSTGGTLTRNTLVRIGTEFDTKNSTTKEEVKDKDLIQYACQYNAAFIVTDGFADATSTAVDTDIDSSDTASNYFNRQWGGSDWTNLRYPYVDGTTILEGTLADIAMKYYGTRLRTDMTAGKVPIKMDDVSPNADRNNNLHLNTFALGLGGSGTIFNIDSTKTQNPFATPFDWPKPTDRSPTAVDDLWHATINGRGKMLSSTDVDSTRMAIEAVINEILDKGSSSSAAAVSNPRLTESDERVYASTFNATNWTGQLHAWKINKETGFVDKNDKWNPSVQARLDARTSADRIIVTYDGKKGIPFQSNNSGLTETQKLKLATDPSATPLDTKDVIEYLRGNRSKEYDPEKDADYNKNRPYRYRANLLGDIVHAQAGLLFPPNEEYLDAGYSKFISDYANRDKMILQGSNDGMLHAFNRKDEKEDGEEAWAYIPNRVIDQGLLPELTKKEGFEHKYYVDGTPTIADIDFNKTDGATTTGPDWKTVFIGSLQKGGRGFYAIDVTDPASMTDETKVAKKVLWEFPNDNTPPDDAKNVGYSFGRPVVTKLKNGNWYVLVTSGYNNDAVTTGGDGKGWLYLLNPRTGNIVYKFSTDSGDAKNPSGLAYIGALQEKYPYDATAEFVYGGDLNGNVWRFDLRDPSDSAKVGPHNLIQLVNKTEKGAIPQPITTAPQIAYIEFKAGDGKKPVIFYGTGRYLAKEDISDLGVQAVYGLYDDLTDTTITMDQLVEQTLSPPTGKAGMKQRTLSTETVAYENNKKGWFVKLNISGERVNVDPVLAFGILAVGSNIPSEDECLPGGSSYMTFFDFKTGGKVKGALDYSSTEFGSTMIAGYQYVMTDQGLKLLVNDTSGGLSTLKTPYDKAAGGIRKTTWRELTKR